MEKLYFVKLGGSVITHKDRPYTPRVDVIKRLVAEVVEVRRSGVKLILGHGSGSYAHTSSVKYRLKEGIVNESGYYGFAVVHYDASKLNMLIVNELLRAGERAFPIHPSSIIVAEDFKVKSVFLDTIKAMLKHNMLPVVYGDVCVDLRRGACILSTEEVIKELALRLKGEFNIEVVVVSDVDGVYTSDPNVDPNAKLIDVISEENIDEVKGFLGSSRWTDVTGGMRHKVEVLYGLAKLGVRSRIINGLVEGNLKKALLGEPIKGTLIT